MVDAAALNLGKRGSGGRCTNVSSLSPAYVDPPLTMMFQSDNENCGALNSCYKSWCGNGYYNDPKILFQTCCIGGVAKGCICDVPVGLPGS